jgi:acyl-CoA synthetase (AMP-forming)/AMP-acid ligase II
MLQSPSPRAGIAALKAVRAYGQIGGLIASTAIKYGPDTGLVDELGRLTFTEMDRRSNALANGLRNRGLEAGTTVGILCRNSRWFLDATFACGKLGARALYLNTDFAGPQLCEVCAREGVQALIHDEEFAERVEGAPAPLGSFVAWTDAEQPPADSLAELIASSSEEPPPPPSRGSSVIMLTSGTTGTPKGAPRQEGRSMAPIGAILSKVPFRSREVTYDAAPMFHALGLTHSLLAIGLGSTVVTRRRFDAKLMLEELERERVTAMIIVPVMLQRLLAALREEPARDLSSLRVIFVAGAQLEADLASQALEGFGNIIYNLYGSTEVAWATIATPEDLRAAPGCAGRAPFGTTVALYDDGGNPIEEPGVSGRIFVGNGFEFEGYTGGGHKEVIDGLMSTGDVGHFDAAQRLFIDGRDDEMIVSGGENVFPREVEELLASHEAIKEAAAIGVPDPDFGHALHAFIVLEPEAELGVEDVQGHVKANLARFKVPRKVHFIEELPRNPSGKVLKRELEARPEALPEQPS